MVLRRWSLHPQKIANTTHFMTNISWSGIFLAFLSLLVGGCRGEDGRIEDDTFVEVYAALLNTASAGGPDSLATVRADSTLEYFGVTRSEFDATMKKYQNNPVRWMDFFDAVRRKLETPVDSVQKDQPS